MATLEKIRSKSVLLFVIIIVALLAFILGDFFNSGRSFFGNGTTIAKAAGEKIDYNDYITAFNAASQAQAGQRHADNDELAQQTIRQLVFETLLEKQMTDMGIKVTDAEIARAMTSEPPHPAAQQFIYSLSQYLGLPTASGATAIDAIKNPSRYNLTSEQLNMLAQQVYNAPTIEAAWAEQEKNVEKAIRMQAYQKLFSGLFTANDLDALTTYNDNMTRRQVSYVSAPYSVLPDTAVQVTEADIKQLYKERKNIYKLDEPTRLVDYVVVDITPSQADFAAAELEVAEAYNGLVNEEGLTAVTTNPKFTRDIITAPVAKLKSNPETRNIPDSLMAAGKVFASPRMNTTYTLTKVLSLQPQVDSVEISSVAFPSKAAADSVLALIQGGTPMDTIVAQNADYAVAPTWFAMIGNNQIAPEMKALFTSQAVGTPFVYSDTLQADGPAVVFNIKSRKAPVNTAEVAVIKYVVDPSNATVSNLKQTLNSFLASNSKGAAFTANADSLYRLQHAEVTPSSAHIGNLPESRRAVKWAMNAKKEEVSKVFEGKDYYLVVAVKDIYDGYRPYTDSYVNDALTRELIADKKGDMLIEQYGTATDLAGYASKIGTSVQSDSTAVFTASRFGNLGFGESKVQAAVAAAKQGQLSGPVKGNNSVVYFIVNGVSNEARPFDATTDRGTFMQMFGINDIYGMLVGDGKVENRSLDFVVDK